MAISESGVNGKFNVFFDNKISNTINTSLGVTFCDIFLKISKNEFIRKIDLTFNLQLVSLSYSISNTLILRNYPELIGINYPLKYFTVYKNNTGISTTGAVEIQNNGNVIIRFYTGSVTPFFGVTTLDFKDYF